MRVADGYSSASCSAACRTSRTARTDPRATIILVTTGGGGDGADLIHDVLDAYAAYPELQHRPLLIVLGPYMPAEEREQHPGKGQGGPAGR